MLKLILGGIKSGKSAFALKLCNNYKRKLYIATLEGNDSETKQKISKHRKERGSDWDLTEEPIDITNVIKLKHNKYEIILLECLNTWINNLLYYNLDANLYINNLIKFLNESKENLNLIIVSNEVGSSVIPENKTARDFINILGIANQKLAAAADNVSILFSGIPLKLK
ncbi:MAG: bifunctional adenosylcobinamide kinase/adenosylcobinamide-phosphate guanylyltransferase [Deferribacterota bacterium]|nr:bifunctional adenosylcobinamide kinase/adenosylcobinamide-phosphate guanylyltransferase [Deferribacterota bacterium]